MVVIGGGTGLPVILNALKDKNAEITAIVTVSMMVGHLVRFEILLTLFHLVIFGMSWSH